MEDLIRRSDAISRKGVSAWLDNMGYPRLANAVMDKKRFPSADRPQGEWIDMGDFEQCSVCKGTRLKEFQSYYGKVTWIKTPYCPNCGARMKGADDERVR